MSKMNLVIDLKGYDGTNSNTCQSNFKRNAQYIGIDTSEETVQEITIAANDFRILFDVPEVDFRKFIYLETSGPCAIQVNDIDEITVKPIVANGSSKNGVYLKTADIGKVVVGNDSLTDSITIYYITSK